MIVRACLTIVFVLGVAVASTAQACSVSPKEPYVKARALVDRTKNIIVGDVTSVRVTKNERRYRVKVVERLKGDAPPEIEITLHNYFMDTDQTIGKRFSMAHASTHETAAFWVGEIQDGFTMPTCATTFDPRRGLHVILLGEPKHVKGFEPIADTSDSWYTTAKRMVAEPTLQGREVSPVEFVRLFYAVHRFACAGANGERCREPRRIWGRPIDWREHNPNATFHSVACPPGREIGCKIFWVFFVGPDQGASLVLLGQPFVAHVTNGRLTLPKEHGDLVLPVTVVNERELAHGVGLTKK